jgi:HAD superfamily hydrolase (TIGR01509 family)
MMRSFDTFLLDVDGTLVDSNDAHAHAWVETFASKGHVVEFARVRRMIGMGGDRLIEEVIGYARGTDANEAIGQDRLKRFRERWLRTVRPLAGARELVLQLRESGKRYAIASAAKSEELQPLLEIANIADLVSIKTTSTDVEESKPDPEIVETALAKLGGDRSAAVMVGDTPYDIRAARAAGVAAITFTSGGWSPADLHGSVAVLTGPSELAEILRSGS